MLKNIQAESSRLNNPENYYYGSCLPERFSLPDSILLFYSAENVTAAQSHSRYLVVIPFMPVVYYLDELRFELQPGQGLFIQPWQKHCQQSSAAGNDRLLITFDVPEPQSYFPGSPVVKLSPNALKCLEKMLKFYREGENIELALALGELLNDMAEYPAVAERQKFSQTVAAVVRFVVRNIESRLDIKYIADKFQLSPSHLRLIFRREMGVSLGKYIAEQRLNMACMRLRNTDLSIQKIAESCGYDTIYAFSHFFKNNTGITPTAFRRNL